MMSVMSHCNFDMIAKSDSGANLLWTSSSNFEIVGHDSLACFFWVVVFRHHIAYRNRPTHFIGGFGNYCAGLSLSRKLAFAGQPETVSQMFGGQSCRRIVKTTKKQISPVLLTNEQLSKQQTQIDTDNGQKIICFTSFRP